MANLAHSLRIKNLRYMSFRPRFLVLAFSFVLTCLGLGIAGCSDNKQNATSTSDTPTDLQGLELTDIPGSDMRYARQIDTSGEIEIEGYVLNNKRTGMWIQYGTNGDIGLINHYVDGELEGTVMRMTYRNQVDLKSTYQQGQLHGPWVSYKFGKVIEERTYKNGKLEGTVTMYDDRTFKVKQEVQYKDGVQDGYFRYYDENGNVTLEYQYKNGEKVAGGMK
jgi:antitoxin component YwqK of YwqJK toxin-antitoxin module